MKFITAILLTALLSFASGLFLPWWGIAPAALLAAILVRQKPGISFLSGMLGVFVLWGGLSWWIDAQNDSLLSEKIAEILPLGGSVAFLVLVTALVGALVGGFAALTGAYLYKARH